MAFNALVRAMASRALLASFQNSGEADWASNSSSSRLRPSTSKIPPQLGHLVDNRLQTRLELVGHDVVP